MLYDVFKAVTFSFQTRASWRVPGRSVHEAEALIDCVSGSLLRVCVSVCVSATGNKSLSKAERVSCINAIRYSLHTVTIQGIFINIPISGERDCSIYGNKLGIVFDVGVEKRSCKRKHGKKKKKNLDMQSTQAFSLRATVALLAFFFDTKMVP